MKSARYTYQTGPEAEGLMYDDVKAFLGHTGCDKRRGYYILLVVSEAFTNALVHGNQWDPQKSVEVRLGINNGVLTADILDEGKGDIERVNDRKPPELLAEGGRGVDLMEAYAENVTIRRRDDTGGLQVSMQFTLYDGSATAAAVPDMEDTMDIRKREEAGVVVIELSGRLDLNNGNKLKEEIKGLLSLGKSSLHLNLADVEFINSSGLGALVSIMKEIRLHRGRLTLSNLADYVREIFEITQLSHIFEIFPTEEEAVNAYQIPVNNQA